MFVVKNCLADRESKLESICETAINYVQSQSVAQNTSSPAAAPVSVYWAAGKRCLHGRRGLQHCRLIARRNPLADPSHLYVLSDFVPGQIR